MYMKLLNINDPELVQQLLFGRQLLRAEFGFLELGPCKKRNRFQPQSEDKWSPTIFALFRHCATGYGLQLLYRALVVGKNTVRSNSEWVVFQVGRLINSVSSMGNTVAQQEGG